MEEQAFLTYETFENRTFDLDANGSFRNETFFRYGPVVTSTLCILFGAVFLLGFAGNLLVMMVIVRVQIMRTAIHFCMFNLAVADFLVIVFCVPANLLGNILNPWVLGLFMCKAANYMQQAFMNARVYTLLALSVTLYHTLTTWVSIPQINNTCIRVILPCIWVFSLVVNLPFAIYFNINEKQACSEKWSSEKLGKIYFVSAQLFMCYFFPLVIMSICYGRIRRFLPKVKHDSVRSRCPCGIRRGWGRNGSERMIRVHWVKILRVMIVVFFLSWLPLLSFAVLVKFVEQDVFDGKIDLLDHIRPLPRWLADTTSYVNPIIYAYFKRNFREGYRIIILEECFKGKSFFGPLKLDIERRPNQQHRFRFTSEPL